MLKGEALKGLEENSRFDLEERAPYFPISRFLILVVSLFLALPLSRSLTPSPQWVTVR